MYRHGEHGLEEYKQTKEIIDIDALRIGKGALKIG